MSSNSKSEDTPIELTPNKQEMIKGTIFDPSKGSKVPPQDTSLDEQLMEVMLYVRTTHEVEHNDNQWAREFVYSFDEAKAKINRLIDDARLDERNKCIRELRGDDE